MHRVFYLPAAFAEDINTVAESADWPVATVATALLIVAIGPEVPEVPKESPSVVPMRRMQVYLPRDIDAKIGEMAQERGITRGVMMRHLVVHALMTIPGEEVQS